MIETLTREIPTRRIYARGLIMMTRSEQDALLNKKTPLTVEEEEALKSDSQELKSLHRTSIIELATLRSKDGLTQEEHYRVDAIRTVIGHDLKHSARMDRKTGKKVESIH